MSTRFARWAGLLAIVATTAIAGRVEAGVVVSNLAEEPFDVDVSDVTWGAQAFFTGGVDQQLVSVTLRLLNGAGPVDVFLYDGPEGAPGDELLSFGSVGLEPDSTEPGFVDHVLAAPSAFTLKADTPYWVVVAFHDDSPAWAYTNFVNYTGSGILGDYALAETEEDELEPFQDAPRSWTVYPLSDGFPYQMAVNARGGGGVVPEPSSLVSMMVGGLALAGLGLARNRRDPA